MAGRIEDYALIGNCETVALVCRDGSIDWLGMPRFDSPACFAALLGTPENGRWKIAPVTDIEDARADIRITRRYRPGTLVLDTEFATETGTVVLTDCMARDDNGTYLIRLVTGVSGSVTLKSELVIRFDYGATVPWVTSVSDDLMSAIAGPDRILVNANVPLKGENMHTVSDFTVAAGQQATFVMSWSVSHLPLPTLPDGAALVTMVERGWQQWSKAAHPIAGPAGSRWGEAALRSLITLKALTHHETGGIIAAATTSLPEQLGGNRNWDYRFCWLRDSTFTLYALIQGGFTEEAKAWQDWLLRAIAGAPEQMQIMYGVAGERRLTEYEVPWLAGYEKSAPVRIGNAASDQVQLDVYGEVMASLHFARQSGLAPAAAAWDLQCALIGHLEEIWDKPDDGIWETRGGRRHFTHSKAMAWLAFDCVVRDIEQYGLEGPLDKWRDIRDRIHAEICERGFDAELNSFVQSYGTRDLDASLLLLPLVGFLPPDDPRMIGTVAAIEKHLLVNGFVARYDTSDSKDGLPPGEGTFLACSFWMVDNYILQGRLDDAQTMFERLLALRNDVGLLAEEYDTQAGRMVGNFPQAFSHVAIANTAASLSQALAARESGEEHGPKGPAQHRAARRHQAFANNSAGSAARPASKRLAVSPSSR